jgi:hypothetical protein
MILNGEGVESTPRNENDFLGRSPTSQIRELKHRVEPTFMKAVINHICSIRGS